MIINGRIVKEDGASKTLINSLKAITKKQKEDELDRLYAKFWEQSTDGNPDSWELFTYLKENYHIYLKPKTEEEKKQDIHEPVINTPTITIRHPDIQLSKYADMIGKLEATPYNIIEQIRQKMDEAEYNVINDVLTAILNRKPDINDLKDVERLFIQGKLDEYTLKFKGKMIGKVNYNYPDPMTGQGNYSVSFEPNEI